MSEQNVSKRPNDLTHMTYRLPLYPGWRLWVWKIGHRWMSNRVLGWFAEWHEYEMTGRFVDRSMPDGDLVSFSADFVLETVKRVR